MKTKKILSLLVAMVLALGCVGITAMAEEPAVEVATYETLVAALKDGGNIKLTDDITLEKAITTQGVTATIDLSGKTLNVRAGDNKFIDESNITIKNGNINIDGVSVKGNAVFCLDEYEKALVTTLTLENVNLTGKDYSSAYGVFYIGKSSVLNVNGGVWNLSNDTHASGGVFKADDSNATLNIENAEMTLYNVRRVVTYADTTITNSAMAISGDADGVDSQMEHGFNRTPLVIDNSTITMENMVGRGITAQNGDVVIKNNSTVTMENVQEATLDVRNGQTVTITDSTVKADKEPTVADGCTINGTVGSLEDDAANNVAKIGEESFNSVMAALEYAVENGASEIKILKDSREVMTSDFEITIKADLTITADEPVKVEFYNENGTTRDFTVNSTNNNKLIIAENVHFDLVDRVIWLGYYGNDVDVQVDGYLGGYQIWHGADTTVSESGTLDSHGEAFIMRRDAVMTLNGGKVNANYFQIYSGHIVAKDADVTAGLVWINNNHSYGGEGSVSIELDNTEFVSNGEVKTYAGADKTVAISLTNKSSLTVKGNLTIDAATVITTDVSSIITTNKITGNGTIIIDAAGFDKGQPIALIDADTTDFTGEIKVINGSGVIAKEANGTVTLMKLPNATVSKCDPLTLEADSYMAWPSGDEKIDRPLEIVMNFKANDTVEESIAGGFNKWLVDFNIKFTGLENGSITADKCYLAGNYGTFGWIVIPTDGLVIEEGVSYPVVANYDATLNYKDICKSVKDFTAAIHVDQAILDKNPNFKVELSLVMTNPDDASDKLIIGEPAVYTADDLKNEKVEAQLSGLYVLRNTTAIEREGYTDKYYRVRAYAAIDSLDYKEVGFQYRKAGSKTYSQSITTKVYTSRKVTNTTTGKEITLTPDYIAPDFGQYIFAINVWANPKNIPADTTLEIRPYAVRKDGSTMYLSDWKVINGLTKTNN